MLLTEQVNINTMQIEIKSMMVGKKQLSLSLMRQIIQEDLIDFDKLLFKGVPWGHVNYFWGDDKHRSYPSAINVIWQKGNELRRSVINLNLRRDVYHEQRLVRDLAEIERDINYYLKDDYYREHAKEKIDKLNSVKADLQKQIDAEIYKRDVYIPNYHKLVEPLKSLDHFYLAV